MREPFLWGEGGKGEGCRASHSSGPCWAWGIKATCLISDIKYSVSFLQVSAPFLGLSLTPSLCGYCLSYYYHTLYQVWDIPGNNASFCSRPGPPTLVSPLSTSSESTYTLLWGLLCSPNSRAICSAFKNAQYGDGKGDLLLLGCINGLWNQMATRGCFHP